MKMAIFLLFLLIAVFCAFRTSNPSGTPVQAPVSQAKETITQDPALRAAIVKALHCQDDEADDTLFVLNYLGIDGITGIQAGAVTPKGFDLQIICGSEHYLFKLTSKFGVDRVINSAGKDIYAAIY